MEGLHWHLAPPACCCWAACSSSAIWESTIERHLLTLVGQADPSVHCTTTARVNDYPEEWRSELLCVTRVTPTLCVLLLLLLVEVVVVVVALLLYYSTILILPSSIVALLLQHSFFYYYSLWFHSSVMCSVPVGNILYKKVLYLLVTEGLVRSAECFCECFCPIHLTPIHLP